MNDSKLSKPAIVLYIFFELIFLSFICVFFALPWSLKFYPMQYPFTVFSVLTTETEGNDASTLLSAMLGFVIPGIAVWIFINLILLLIWKYKNLNHRKIISVSFYIKLFFCIIQFIIACFALRVWNYPKIIYQKLKEPEFSQFYDENYIDISEVKIIPPEKKRNLIFIFMESMESSYTDIEHGGVFKENLIPNLTRLAEENINFSETEKIGGAINLQSSSWTVSGLLSKLLAVPYYFPFSKSGSKLKQTFSVECLPSAVALTDILTDFGYKCVFSMGSEKNFEYRDILLESHGYEIHDISWYKKNGFLCENYKVFWGFEDLKLFEFAKKELDTLSLGEQPFVYSLITVDTHFPSGFVCENCKNDFSSQMQNVIRCSDEQVYNFVRWIQNQSWYENTMIVITGDHNYLDSPLNNFIRDECELSYSEAVLKRRVLDIIINPYTDVLKSEQKFRRFSSFDFMPTILELMGYKLSEDGLAFGRSLLGNSKTLVELYDEEEMEKEILRPTVQYESLKRAKTEKN